MTVPNEPQDRVDTVRQALDRLLDLLAREVASAIAGTEGRPNTAPALGAGPVEGRSDRDRTDNEPPGE